MLHLDRGEPELALEGLHAAEALAAEQRLGPVIAPGFLRGAALMAEGAFDEAIARLREGLAGRLGAMFAPYGRARLAEALTRQSSHEAALATVREALEEQERTGQRRWEPELHRVEGAAQQGLNRIEEAKARSKRHCASRDANRRSPMNYAPRQVLPGYGVNRAGPRKRASCSHPSTASSPRASDTADLKEAKALLYELA